jgi:hypothetical protein
LPSLVDLARAGGAWEILLDACRRHGDEVTFAAAIAERMKSSKPPEWPGAEA